MIRSAEDQLQELSSLDESQCIEASGGRTYYVPGSGFFIGIPAPAENTQQPAQDSHQIQKESHQPAMDSHQLLVTLPPQLAARIPAAGRRLRRTAMRALIKDLCTWQTLSARDLAEILGGRAPKPLVRDYLSPMVNDEILAYTIPEMENHPEQRYTVPSAPTTD